MSKKISFTLKTLFFCWCSCSFVLKAQYVSLADTGFTYWLKANGYAQCFQANNLDTTCTAVLNAKYINISYTKVSNLDGLQYFKGLDSLRCNADSGLSSIPALPPHLKLLECRNNILTSLPSLPDSLLSLGCETNHLSSLPALPATLQHLSCYNNLLSSLPVLPTTLRELYCSGNQIDSLPSLPDSLATLSCFANKLNHLPLLPNTLQVILCSNNVLNNLPALPTSLRSLDCNTNALTALPALPDSLNYLGCYHNHLAGLPQLPAVLTALNCEYNNLASLPELPDSLNQFYCNNNPALHCFPLLKTIGDFEFYNTGVTCLPNYGNVYVSNPSLTSLPLCDPGNNTHGCLIINGIEEIEKVSFKLYPNPASQEIAIAISENVIGGKVKIMDVEGREILNFDLQSSNSKFEIYAPGIYFVKLTSLDGQSLVKKVVVQ